MLRICILGASSFSLDSGSQVPNESGPRTCDPRFRYKFRIILTMLYICFNGKNQNSLDDGDLSMLMGTHTVDYQMFFCLRRSSCAAYFRVTVT